MEHKDFPNVYRYAGGLEAWETAGYPLIGSDISKALEPDDVFMSE